jgi:hypothetical protein
MVNENTQRTATSKGMSFAQALAGMFASHLYATFIYERHGTLGADTRGLT